MKVLELAIDLLEKRSIRREDIKRYPHLKIFNDTLEVAGILELVKSGEFESWYNKMKLDYGDNFPVRLEDNHLKTRCKFKCASIDRSEGSQQVNMEAVIDDSPENAEFWKFTPAGQLNITLHEGAGAFNKFEEGKEYFLDISVAE